MRLNPGETFTISLPANLPMTFAWCPPGTFLMGNEHQCAVRVGHLVYGLNEKPVHIVTLTKGFLVGIYPVTQFQWAAIMGPDELRLKGSNAHDPVVWVSWEQSNEFCRRLTTRLNGKAVARLPTEAQWEYACRAGATTEYYTGDGEAALKKAGWYFRNSGITRWLGAKYGHRIHRVGQLAPNAWNLYDMHGNVWEWCSDRYGNYTREASIDPTGPVSGYYRVVRGGCFDNDTSSVRSSSRDGNGESLQEFYIGFRVALILPD